MTIDKSNPEHMQTYLQHALTFEKLVYVWSNALTTANRHVNRLSNQKSEAKYELERTAITLEELDSKTKTRIQHKQQEIEQCKKIINRSLRTTAIKVYLFTSVWLLSALFAFLKAGFNGAIVASLPYPLVLFLVWVFKQNSVSEADQARNKLAKYEEDIQNNTDSSQARRQKLLLSEQSKELRCAYEAIDAQLSIATRNQRQITKSIQAAENTLKEIYALDVLPTKYRCLTAVATLCEYLENGVCTTVQGHGGIYSTYEYHYKLGIIIAKLDDIIDRLDQIIDNQRLLYETVTEANQSLQSINKELGALRSDYSSYTATSLELQRQENATVQWAAWSQWANGRY